MAQVAHGLRIHITQALDNPVNRRDLITAKTRQVRRPEINGLLLDSAADQRRRLNTKRAFSSSFCLIGSNRLGAGP